MLTYSDITTLIQESFGVINDRIAAGEMPDISLLASIALAESAGNPLAFRHNINGTIDRGLFQINSAHKAEFPEFKDFAEACYSPEESVHIAIAIWQQQGYRAWTTFNRLP
jgi:hypothetical protein